MFLTHTNSVYSEKITLIDHVTYPQYGHQVGNGGGLVVSHGIRTMPEELVNYVLYGKHGAKEGTASFITNLTKKSNYKVGLILAAGGNTWTGYTSTIVLSDKYPALKVLAMGGTQIYAGYIANKIGKFDYISTDSSSCISGHSAWYTAKNMLDLGRLDAVVVIAVDNGLAEEYLYIFGKHSLSKLAEQENDPLIVKFRLGQGCNISVFESDKSSNSAPLARITDMCIAAEYHDSPMGISKSGAGYSRVIQAVDANKINFIKTHSTFSTDNKIEDTIIKQKFGDIKTINYKLRIGHTIGPSTAIETALAIQEESGKFLSLGAGMGNVFSSAVVEIL